jgi:hypothetical protein
MPPKNPRDAGRRTKSTHPFALWLVESGQTAATVARIFGIPESNVKSWFAAEKRDLRPIPEEYAVRLQYWAGTRGDGAWKLPANSSTWPQGIRKA